MFSLSSDLGRRVVEGFLESSRPCIETIVGELHRFEGERGRRVNLFWMKDNKVNEIVFGGERFFLRSSVEYSNPQLTVEELQGIIAARLLEVCGNYFDYHGFSGVDREDVDEICEMLSRPPFGKIVSFLLNTDDVEPDRYSMNPLKESIVKSGQSAFPSASVETEGLEIDKRFVEKYEGALISRDEAELIDRHIKTCDNSYMDMVDAVKQEQLEYLSKSFGIDLRLPLKRMPLAVLEKEGTDGLLHYIVKESHKDYESIERVYNCMDRSMKKRTTLLTIPHSEKGYGSKRAVRGRIYFEDKKLQGVKVTYQTTPLYPNAIDPKDVSVAVAEDDFTVEGDRLTGYDYSETPSSPQFILYSLGSPEDAVIWHGIGAFGASQLVRSYTTTRVACARDSMLRGLEEKYGIVVKVPLQFNIVPENMWAHPKHNNIDASIGSVEDLYDLAKMGMRLECLSAHEYARR